MGSATENQKANMQILCLIKAKCFGLRKVIRMRVEQNLQCQNEIRVYSDTKIDTDR